MTTDQSLLLLIADLHAQIVKLRVELDELRGNNGDAA